MDITRRHFFSRTSTGIGIAALGSLLAQDGFAAAETSATGGLPGLPHFAPKAKRVIFLLQSGGPSQMDLFDYKPHARQARRQGTARLRPHGPAHHRHDLGAERAFPVAPLASSSSQQHGQSRRVGQRTAAAHREDRRRHLPSSSR